MAVIIGVASQCVFHLEATGNQTLIKDIPVYYWMKVGCDIHQEL
jgi:hypothetical protein